MKSNVVVNYLVVFLLSAIAATLYFSSPTYKNHKNQINLPDYIRINLNQNNILTKIKPAPELAPLVREALLKENIAFSKFVSPIYVDINTNYYMSFYESQKTTAIQQDIHFVILKKMHQDFQIVATLKVTAMTKNKIQLSYGHIEYLQENDFNLKVLKLAQTVNFEESF